MIEEVFKWAIIGLQNNERCLIVSFNGMLEYGGGVQNKEFGLISLCRHVFIRSLCLSMKAKFVWLVCLEALAFIPMGRFDKPVKGVLCFQSIITSTRSCTGDRRE